MRLSQYPISTLKEVPADAEVISHQLMLRAGMIRRLAAGLYTWLPMGLRTLRKVERIIREEMDRAGALELCMPTVQPGELWQESGRWSKYGPELLRFKDRHQRDFAYGLLEAERVAVVPGTAFGENGSGYVRASFATSYDHLSEACTRIERYVQGRRRP